MSFDPAIYQKLRAGETGSLPLDRALWRLTGNDRVRYLNGQTTNDIVKLEKGKTLYAAVTNVKGKMEGDLFVAASDDALWLDAAADLRDTLGPRLEKYLIADDAALEEATDWKLFHVFGSKRPESEHVFENPRFGFKGFDVWSKQNFTAGISVPAEVAETFRIEHALPKWGSDMTTDTLPPEAGLDRNGISYTKGCYVGQEVIARIKSIGHVNKHLACLQCEGFLPSVGMEIKAEGKAVGKVTSAIYSPELKANLALGYVQRTHFIVGKKLEIDGKACTIIDSPLRISL